MPFALLFVGVILVVGAVRDTLDGERGLYSLLKNDFSGPNNYAYWLASMLVIGAIGYIKPLQPLSRIFLVLLTVVLVLTHGGLFDQFNQQLFGGTLTGSQSVKLNTPIFEASSIASGGR